MSKKTLNIDLDLTINDNIKINFYKAKNYKNIYFLEFNSENYNISITLNYSNLHNLKYQIGCL